MSESESDPESESQSECMLDKWPVIMPRPGKWTRPALGRISDVSRKCTSISIARNGRANKSKRDQDRWLFIDGYLSIVSLSVSRDFLSLLALKVLGKGFQVWKN